MPRTAKSASTTKEQQEVPGVKAFRSSAEVENFLRFVHENNLRRETHLLLAHVLDKVKAATRKTKKRTRKLQ